MTNKLTSLEAIGFGIRSEEDAAKFYAHIAKMITNDMVRIKYENLAKEEINHGKILTELYKKMSETDEKPPRVPGTPNTAEKGDVPKDISDSLEDLLNLAIEREKKAKDFYLKAAKEASDHSGERIFRYLATVEEGHEAMLKKELEAYLGDKDWYMGDAEQEFMHIGP